ncbi:MAG TPA: glycosyltransferase family 4 protein [Alphaproteobacteria bacterium]|nr:glycosyltransferase family 4 protein [Alphaproteobacteria bacterium]
MASASSRRGSEEGTRLKILLCHNFYQQPGGEQRAVLAAKALLEREGHQVLFFQQDSLDIESYHTREKIAFFPRTIFSHRIYNALLQIAAREEPHIAHVHNVFPLLSPSVYIALHDAAIPVVQTIHNYRFMCINGLFLRNSRFCERCKTGNFFSGFKFRCYRDSYLLSGLYALTIGGHRRWGTFDKIDHFIALTNFVAEKLLESGLTTADKISVLGNFLPVPLAEYGRSAMRTPYVVYIGRLSPEKGILTLLDAIRPLPHVRLKVLGSGPLQDSVTAYIRSHRLYNVDLLGYVGGEERDRILRGAWCCVVPSECYETFPLIVLESAAVGTPIVASRIGSLATLVADGETGLLFTPGDSADLRSKLEYVIANPEGAIRMGQHARRWVETSYTSEAHYEALMQIYQQVLR